MTIVPARSAIIAVACVWMLGCCGAVEDLGVPGLGGEPEEVSEDLATAFIAETNENCSTTFCDEEFDYWFESMTCDPSTCTVTFTATYHEEIKPREGTVTVLALEAVDANGELSEAFEASFWAALIEWESQVILEHKPAVKSEDKGGERGKRARDGERPGTGGKRSKSGRSSR